MHNRTNQKSYTNKGNMAVLSLIEGEKKVILDVGCGAGDNAQVLKDLGHLVDGITLSEIEASACTRIMRNVYVHNLEGGLPDQITDKYDFIICSHVLEHIVYPEALLNDMRKVLNESGRVIVALPNLMHYKSRIQLMLGNFNYDESGIWDYTHVKWYTFKTGRRLLEKNGFIVVKQLVDGEIPFMTIFKNLPIKIKKYAYLILTKISKGMFGGQMIYMAKVDSDQTNMEL